MVDYVADLHIHSKYARACSKDLELPKIAEACVRKGIQIVSTGDFTHPLWFQHMEECLEEIEITGLYRVKNAQENAREVRFIIGAEISVVYKHKGATRRLHLLVFAPSIDAAQKFNAALAGRGVNLRSDGRPIMGVSAKDIVVICKSIDERMMVIPAHAWTPWFGVFGSKSGYNSLEDCFEEYTSEIFAIETGLSSDPIMNRRLSALDHITLVSNSDAHSLDKLGREANVFRFEHDSEVTYDEIRRILKTGDKDKFLYTIEFYPEEGMYHIDGHRDCGFSCQPNESKRTKYLCPKCQKPLTIGVMHRVDDLADRTVQEIPPTFISHKYIVPLREIIAQAFDIGVGSKKVAKEYDVIIAKLGNEFSVLLQCDIATIERVASDKNIARGIRTMRKGVLSIKPGFDGVYGVVDVFAGKKYGERK